MIVCKLATSDGRVDLPHAIFPNPKPIIIDVLEHGLSRKGCSLGWPIQALDRKGPFEDALMDAVYNALESDLRSETSLELLKALGEDDGMIVGCYGAEEHTDTDVSVFPDRWLVVLQCGSGYRFKGFDDNGSFDVEIEPGLVIGFNETEIHSLEIADRESIDVNWPNLFYTLPDPNRSVHIARDIGFIDAHETEAA